MVNLVIVSHSRQLAQGACEIARQMAGGEVTIGAVGGLFEADGSDVLGTDPVQIAAAIEKHWSDAGVLLLVDMGSAVMSAEQALEFLPPEMAQRCLISNAPLVEGAIVAALEAGMGRSLEEVNNAAELACTMPKR